MGFKSPRSQASRRSGFTFSRLATGSGGYPLSCRAQVSTVGLTSAAVEVLIFKIYPIFSSLGNSTKNQDFGSNHGLLIEIYLFYENWSTETFRKKEAIQSRGGVDKLFKELWGGYKGESNRVTSSEVTDFFDVYSFPRSFPSLFGYFLVQKIHLPDFYVKRYFNVRDERARASEQNRKINLVVKVS